MILLYYVNDMGSEFQQHTLTIDKERKKASQTGLWSSGLGIHYSSVLL